MHHQAALQRIAVTQAVKEDEVTWVLTVPVCCSEPAKYFMRQAAIKGGFIKGGDDDEVCILARTVPRDCYRGALSLFAL